MVARYRNWRGRLHWRQHRDLESYAAGFGLTPAPPREGQANGERAEGLLLRLFHLHESQRAATDELSVGIFARFEEEFRDVLPPDLRVALEHALSA
jgi:hypothetical protein